MESAMAIAVGMTRRSDQMQESSFKLQGADASQARAGFSHVGLENLPINDYIHKYSPIRINPQPCTPVFWAGLVM